MVQFDNVSVSGQCRQFDERITVVADLEKFQPLGQPKPLLRIRHLNCKYLEECQDPLECPVALSAKV